MEDAATMCIEIAHPRTLASTANDSRVLAEITLLIQQLERRIRYTENGRAAETPKPL
jgi:hypothetical protein